jgi:FMN-dependent dehydrogenase
MSEPIDSRFQNLHEFVTPARIGRLYVYGLAAAGVEGVARLFEMLEDEIRICLSLLGVTGYDQQAVALGITASKRQSSAAASSRRRGRWRADQRL